MRRLLLVLGLASGVAVAQDGGLKKRGDQAFAARDYAQAAELYGQALAEHPSGALLFNLARTHQALGRYVEALEFLRRFELEAEPETQARVPDLPGLRRELLARLHHLSVIAPARGEVRVRGKLLGVTPLEVSVDPGVAVVEVSAPGHERWETEVELIAGGTTALDAPLVERVAALVPPATVPREALAAAVVTVAAPDVPVTHRWWFWTGAAVVVVGVAGASLALALPRAPGVGSLSPANHGVGP